MILHPAVLALLVGGGAVCLLLLLAAANAAAVLRRWDFASASAAQLSLERRTTAISTLASLALALQAASLALFVFTLEDIHPLFTGAMCATGSLNANPAGWRVLLVKTALLLASALWLGLHRLDLRAGDFPLVRTTSAGILLLAPLAALDTLLLLGYFRGLDPEVITSCCGSLFAEDGIGVASTLAALPPAPMRAAFFGCLLGVVAANRAARIRPGPLPRIALGVVALLFFPIALAAVVSFVSVGIYRLPGHHCPFDVLQRAYGFVGYPLYLGIFGAVAANLLPALALAVDRQPSVRPARAALEPSWLRLGLISALLCGTIAAWAAVRGIRLE